MKIIGIAAVSDNGVIGKEGKMPWHCSEDLKFFKEKTLGKVILLGRKTWESLGSKPLPNRRHLILSRTLEKAEGAEIIRSLDELPDVEELYVIGGAEIYKLFLKQFDIFYLTIINEEVEGDTFLPPDIFLTFNDRYCIKEIPNKATWWELSENIYK